MIFSHLVPFTTENLYLLYPVMTLNNSLSLFREHNFKYYPKVPLWCDFQTSSAVYHRELGLVVPRGDPEQLRGSDLKTKLKF